jgi:hypothetical protein
VNASRDQTPLAAVASRVADAGLALFGSFHPEPDDGVPSLPDGDIPATVLLVGNIGSSFWAHVQAAPERGGPDPVDRWTARVLGDLAAGLAATAIFPFGGPPHHPFQRWARRADPDLSVSPLGLLIHPDHGLWHALRGALLFRERLLLPSVAAPRPNPCASCAGRPCLDTCPVGAFRAGGYDVAACRAYLHTLSGQPCVIQGCRARVACPVGRTHAYTGAQAQHHMRAFARP